MMTKLLLNIGDKLHLVKEQDLAVNLAASS